MNKFKFLVILVFLFSYSSIWACKYTIREIGFSTLSKVTYVLYRVDENTSFFSKQLEQSFSNSNINGIGISLDQGENNPIVQFVRDNKLSLPAFILTSPDGRMLALENDYILEGSLSSPVRNQLLERLPNSYASVILVDGKNDSENKLAQKTASETCKRIENIMPNMPKQVDVGPSMIAISNDQFEQEKVMLWSFGINKIPDQPIALVVYGKGRIMGEKIPYTKFKDDIIYKYLSIIGADCECGLDRKWMLGYQMPLNWPIQIRQDLNDKLGFDVDNPMVLTEMSRILAIENKVAVDPDGVSFEPVVFDLDKEFDDVSLVKQESKEAAEKGLNSGKMILYTTIVFILITAVGAIFILKRKT